MTQRDKEDVLFPEEIIPWDEVLRLVINLRIPFRHRAKGIECITGGWGHHQPILGAPIQWLPVVLSKNLKGFIKEHLQELPPLEFPVPLGIANEFIDKFIMLNDSPNIVPSFLTRASLINDQQARDSQVTPEKEELNRLMSEREVFLVDASRRKCKCLAHGVYFTNRGAIQYLENKGLLDRAFATGCSWRELIREPEIGGLPPLTDDRHYGLPKGLIENGIQEYRRTLTSRKLEAFANQLSQPHPKLVEKPVVEEDSDETNAPTPETESVSGLVESRSKLAVDVVPMIQISSQSAVAKINVKPSSPKDLVVSERNEAKSTKENPATESGITLVNETEPASTRLIGMKEVTERLGVTRQTVYHYMDPESSSYIQEFPLSRMLNGENKWIESEIDAFINWLTTRKKKRKIKQNQ